MNAPPPFTSAATPVKSALRTLDVIEFVVAHRQGVVAQEIAGALGIPVSSLSYLLTTLADRGYLVREGRRYLPGPGLERLRAAPEALPLSDRVAPLVRALKGELNETASFMVQRGWEVEALVTEASDQALRYAVDPGTRRPLHALAAGKVILAALPAAERARYFAETTVSATPSKCASARPCYAPRRLSPKSSPFLRSTNGEVACRRQVGGVIPTSSSLR